MVSLREVYNEYVNLAIKNGLLTTTAEVQALVAVLEKAGAGTIDDEVKKESHQLFTKLIRGGVFKECGDAKLAMDIWNTIMTHKKEEKDEGSSTGTA